MRVVDLHDEGGLIKFDGLHVRSHRLTHQFLPGTEHPAHTAGIVRTK